jgi:hypothetical protein
LISVVVGLALGACSQSLTPDKTGSGGTGGVVMGSTGGAIGSTGGAIGSTGGAGGQSLCSALVTEYQAAVQAERSCAIGGTGQCDQQVVATLSVCGSCPVAVNDATKPNAIRTAWESAGCAMLNPAPPCALIGCPLVTTSGACIENPDDTTGSAGICSFAPGTGGTSGTGGMGATGGASGKGGTGGSSPDGGVPSCGELSVQYAAAMAAAKGCNAGATGQCAQQVPSSLGVCAGGCMDYVNDSTELYQILMTWSAEGCGNAAVVCPLIACLPPTSSTCVASDAGIGTCTSNYGTVDLR